MIVAKFANGSTAIANGLMQWDYGQELVIENSALVIPEGSEVNFYQEKLSSVAYMKKNHVMIPDIMLQNCNEILAYVYVRTESSGETILSIKMLILSRPRPGNYVLPEYEDYKRLLPSGGEEGQILAKKSDRDFDIGWDDGVEMEGMTDDEIDAIFNKE